MRSDVYRHGDAPLHSVNGGTRLPWSCVHLDVNMMAAYGGRSCRPGMFPPRKQRQNRRLVRLCVAAVRALRAEALRFGGLDPWPSRTHWPTRPATRNASGHHPMLASAAAMYLSEDARTAHSRKRTESCVDIVDILPSRGLRMRSKRVGVAPYPILWPRQHLSGWP